MLASLEDQRAEFLLFAGLSKEQYVYNCHNNYVELLYYKCISGVISIKIGLGIALILPFTCCFIALFCAVSSRVADNYGNFGTNQNN